MDRDWIYIKGKKLLCQSFICCFDSYKVMNCVYQHGGQSTLNRFDSLCYVVKEITNDYLSGKDYISDELKGFFERYGMKLPVERKLPEALEELFEQMQATLHIDLTVLLDLAVKLTERQYQRMQEEQQKEQKRLTVIHSLIDKNKISGSTEVYDKIHNVLVLQKAKSESSDYELEKGENAVAMLWCSLLMTSLFSGTITHGQMLELVENRLINESEISSLLESYGIEKDYEWYSEDFIGCELSCKTDIKIKDVLLLCTERIDKILGIKFDEY